MCDVPRYVLCLCALCICIVLCVFFKYVVYVQFTCKLCVCVLIMNVTSGEETHVIEEKEFWRSRSLLEKIHGEALTEDRRQGWIHRE